MLGRMLNKAKIFGAFSLVELMISLITISLITAAFTPIITKKLAQSGITVGAFGEKGEKGDKGDSGYSCPSNITCESGYYLDGTCKCQKCSDPNCTVCEHDVCSICVSGFMLVNGKCVNKSCVNQKDANGNDLPDGAPSEGCCNSVGAIYVPKEYTGTVDLCMMRYNAVDEENVYQVGMNYTTYHLPYPKLGIKIVQAGTKCDTGKCCWKGNTANSTDEYSGYSGKNRTVCQQAAAKTICNNWAIQGSVAGAWRLPSGTEMTNVLSNAGISFFGASGLQMCGVTGGNTCVNVGGYCDGSSSSNGSCYPKVLWLSENARSFEPSRGSNNAAKDDKATAALSVRCVTENVNISVSPLDEETKTVGQYEPRNQEDCPKGTLFFNKKYFGGKSNLCIMQYNAVDDRYLQDGKYYHLPYAKLGIRVVDAAQKCDTTGYCCWKGATAKDEPAAKVYTNYSGVNRSVCQQAAAKTICANWAYANSKAGHWRLMTKDEATSFKTYINADGFYNDNYRTTFAYFTRYLDTDGLQLCGITGGNTCTNVGGYCDGSSSSNGSCYPKSLWLNEDKIEFNVSNTTISTNDNANGAYSVRCVTDNIRKEINDTVETYKANEPRNQSDCSKYNSLFIDKKYLNGADRNICMTKYNFADIDAISQNSPYIGNNTIQDYEALGIKVVQAGTSCATGKCCWKGTTATGDTSTGSYSGSNRTVCQQAAAKILCNSWAPDSFTYKKWRLMTKAEADNSNNSTGLAKYIQAETNNSSFITRYLDTDGLQLCGITGGNTCTNVGGYCNGSSSSNGSCYPKSLWLNEDKIEFNVSNTTISTNDNANGAYSVRCVTDTIAYD